MHWNVTLDALPESATFGPTGWDFLLVLGSEVRFNHAQWVVLRKSLIIDLQCGAYFHLQGNLPTLSRVKIGLSGGISWVAAYGKMLVYPLMKVSIAAAPTCRHLTHAHARVWLYSSLSSQTVGEQLALLLLQACFFKSLLPPAVRTASIIDHTKIAQSN